MADFKTPKYLQLQDVVVRRINIAREFHTFPLGRYRKDGDHTGEHFRDDLLIHAINEAEAVKFGVVVVEFHGATCLHTGFLEEAFGGLLRHHGKTEEGLRKVLRFDTTGADYMDYRVKDTWSYISDMQRINEECPRDYSHERSDPTARADAARKGEQSGGKNKAAEVRLGGKQPPSA